MAMQRKRRRRSGGNNNNNPNPNRHYESNGPDVRIRGSAQQILDKYLQYARDAQTSGDRVKAEALFQHAEHYARIVALFEKQKEEARLEREAREAAKAEERAQREAERAAQAESEEGAASDSDQPVTEGAATEDGAEASDGPKPRRRSRKPRDGDAAQADDIAATDTSEGVTEEAAADANEEAPKRRRSYARKKPEASETVEESDGVMKTLARGSDEVIAEAE